MNINPYLNFPGNTEEAFNFYKSVFGGEFTALHRFEGQPGCDGFSEMDKNKIMHVSLPVGGSILMGTDVVEGMGQPFVEGNNISMSLNPQSRQQADTLFAALSANGKPAMPMADAPWGDYFGMLTDQFGINWLISYNENYK